MSGFPLGDSSYGRNFDLDKNEIQLRKSKIAKFGCKMLWNEENIALWSSQILYIFCITCGKNNHFPLKNGYFSRA
jgi:hypothetical protein